jgi:hypothetical protein
MFKPRSKVDLKTPSTNQAVMRNGAVAFGAPERRQTPSAPQ